MKTLDELAIYHKADKGSADHTHEQGHTVKGHGYACHYDSAFAALRNKPVKMLEVGVGSGESIRMWLEYFNNPEAQVHGIDIVYDTNDWNREDQSPHPRYTFTAGDQGSETFWTEFIKTHGSNWDILCDDGSHSNKDIITTFRMMWPHIKPGGYYAIEDLAAAYSGMEFFLKPGFPNHMDWIKEMLDQINYGFNQIDEMRFSTELCILRKKS